LSATDQGTDRSWIEIERLCDFGVTEAIRSEQQQLGLAVIDGRQYLGDTMSLLGERSNVFWRVCFSEFRLAFAARVSRLLSNVIESDADSGSIQPSTFTTALFPGRLSPEFPENVDSEILGASRVANDANDYARYARVMSTKSALEIRITLDGAVSDRTRGRVHVRSTIPTPIL
jgi:hypothetical protein